MKKFLKIGSFLIAAILLAGLFVTAFEASEPVAAALGVAMSGAGLFMKFTPAGVLGAYVGATGSEMDGSVQVVSTDKQRGAYTTIKKDFGDRAVEGYLRLETPIDNSSGKLRFNTFVGDAATVYATERRLDRNDKFVVTHMSIQLLKQDTVNGKTNAIPQTYPNITIFGAAAAADLLAIYAGSFSVSVNNVKKIPAFPMRWFYYVPETQQTGATNYDEKSYRDGFKPVTPFLILDGSGSNELEVTFPTYAGFAGGTSATANFTHRAVLFLEGFLIPGGSANS